MSYHIGSFNIRDFNYSSQDSKGESIKRDFEKISEIIISEKFDVIAIQEVNSESAIKHLTNVLNKRKNLFREYDFAFGGDMPTHSKDPERYGFIWNIKRFRLLDVPNKKNPMYYINAGGVNLQRPPYYARFTSRGMLGGSNFELRLVNIHILDADRELDKINEFDVLVRNVLPRICDHQQLSRSCEMMPAYTILLGDYNICLNKGNRAEFKIERITQTNYTGKNRSYITVQEKPTSLRVANEQQTIEECYANNFDHFTYEDDLEARLRISDINRVDALEKYFNSEKTPSEKLSSYREKVSDHVPIIMNFDLK